MIFVTSPTHPLASYKGPIPECALADHVQLVLTDRTDLSQGQEFKVLANLFLHYAFDMWIGREFPLIPFERYADDAICHCKSVEEARALRKALGDRFAACKLVLHPEKTKIVYCKDANRRGDFPAISFDFPGFQFRARKTMWQGKAVHGFLPAVKALKRIGGEIRRWRLHLRSDKSLQDLAEIYNPVIRGWIGYYSNFYRTQLRPTLKRIDLYVIRWARRNIQGTEAYLNFKLFDLRLESVTIYRH